MKRGRELNGFVHPTRAKKSRKTAPAERPEGVGPIIDLLPELRTNVLYPALDSVALVRLGATCQGFYKEILFAGKGAGWIPTEWRKKLRKLPSHLQSRAAAEVIRTQLRPAGYFLRVPNPGTAVKFRLEERNEIHVVVTFQLGTAFIAYSTYTNPSGCIFPLKHSTHSAPDFIALARQREILESPRILAQYIRDKGIPAGLVQNLQGLQQTMKEKKQAREYMTNRLTASIYAGWFSGPGGWSEQDRALKKETKECARQLATVEKEVLLFCGD